MNHHPGEDEPALPVVCTGYQGPIINVQDMEQAIQGDIRKCWRKGKTA